jgi:dTDP-4-dehydrorhamnose reductase
MRLLVTGGTGQVARAIAARAPEAVVVGRPAFDFDKPETIAACFHRVKPDLVVNAAAFTAVDLAEDEEDAANRANSDGPGELARLCTRAGIPLIHISTDYVFDGAKAGPYVEADPTAPQGAYGRSKLNGEHAVLYACPRAIVLRTAWVYAARGKNFVLTMLNAARRLPELRVVADQVGCPTSADDLAAVILAIAARIERDGWKDEFAGVFHAAGAGETSWHGFAEAIFELAAPHGVPVPRVAPIATAEWPTKAKRPANSRLDCSRLERVFGLRLPPWRESLARVVAEACAAPGG